MMLSEIILILDQQVFLNISKKSEIPFFSYFILGVLPLKDVLFLLG